MDSGEFDPSVSPFCVVFVVVVVVVVGGGGGGGGGCLVVWLSGVLYVCLSVCLTILVDWA